MPRVTSNAVPPAAPRPVLLPILKLPMVVFRQIVKDISLIDMLNFATTSEACLRKLEEARVPVEAKRLEFEQSVDSYLVRVRVAKKKSLVIQFKQFKYPSDSKTTLLFGDAVVCHEKKAAYSDKVKKRAYHKTFYFNKDAIYLRKYFEMLSLCVRLFRGCQINLKCHCYKAKKVFDLVRATNRGIEDLSVYWDVLGGLKANELTALIRTPVADRFLLEVFAGKVKYTGAIPNDFMFIHNAGWLTRTSLSTMNCETMIAYETKLAPQDLISFIQAWKRNELPRLKFCLLKQLDNFSSLEFDVEAIADKKWSFPMLPLVVDFTHPLNMTARSQELNRRWVPTQKKYCIYGHNGSLAVFVCWLECFTMSVIVPS